MKPEEDAYGQEIWAFYQGREVSEIVERDDGYIDATLSPKVYFSEFEDWSPVEQKAMEFVKGRVLDIGCGAGRHSLYLQKNGFDVLGIDNSPLAIKVCKLRELKKAKVMSIEDINFKPNSFDTIIMMGNNFGLFGSFKKARKLLERFHEMTSEGALIIAHTRDPYKTDNPAHLEYQEFNRKRGRMSGQLRLRIRFRKYAGQWFDYLIVSKKEMQDILKGTRWKVKEFIDSKNSQYIAIIEKGTEYMVNKNLVGRCGIYCGSCIIYRAYKDSEQLRQRVAERQNCEPKDIRCEGCQTVLTNGWDRDKQWGKNCRIVTCLETKGLDFCYECDIYPSCEKFGELANHLLKYSESLTENLKKIKAGKVEEWLKEEEEKWRCHECGKPISRHLDECHWCGEELEK